MNAPQQNGGRRFATALMLALAWLAATLWMRPLALPDEGRYVGVAWEMLRSGDWLTPTLDGLPFFHKPPLFYWITAGSLGLFGPHEWAGRIASLLGASAALVTTALFVRRWLGKSAARATLWVLATQPLVFFAAQYANLDMLVAGCISVAIVLFAHVVLAAAQGEAAPRARLGGWAALALGVLAKGLIGVLLPALVLGAWLLATRRVARWRVLWSWAGVALFLALVLPWFIAMQQRHADFLHYFIVVQHFQRYAEAGFNNVRPFWFYPAVLALLGLPWSIWAAALWRRAPARDEQQASVRLLMLLWALIVVGFFSLPRSKLVGYVLPAAAPLAVLVGDAARTMLATRRWRVTAVLALLICTVAVVMLSVKQPKSSRHLAAMLREQRPPGEPLLFAGAYFYDLPFYAQLEHPVPVIENWADPAIAHQDSWRKELVDAAAFAADGGRGVLVGDDALGSDACRRGHAWLVATRSAAQHLHLAERADKLASEGDNDLWRLRPGALSDCPGTPSGG